MGAAQHRRAPRIIPAYAGCTQSSTTRRLSQRDHPRIRGVHSWPGIVRKKTAGSSPHTRGAPTSKNVTRPCDRIIPAYAGCTKTREYNKRVRKDHPRIRGVHRMCGRVMVGGTGSSPHTRGARIVNAVPRMGRWIIPAYAGCTSTAPWVGPSSRDHPRIRGVHASDEHEHDPCSGSSPHTRGAQNDISSVELSTRIIPAYAGCTKGSPMSSFISSDHPRIRGVHSATAAETAPGAGSSPHTRGARSMLEMIGDPERIIPAYAGCTHKRPEHGPIRGDHPRIRGVHTWRSLGSQQERSLLETLPLHSRPSARSAEFR